MGLWIVLNKCFLSFSIRTVFMKNKFLPIKRFNALGTQIEAQIVVKDENEIKKALDNLSSVEKIYRDKEKILSRFDSESELSKLNGNLGKFFEVSADMVYLARKSLEYYNESGGIFDPRILDALEGIGYDRDFRNVKNRERKNGEIFSLNGDLKDDLIVVGERMRFEKKMDFAGIAKGYITDEVAKFLRAKGWKNFLVDSGGDMYASGINIDGKKWTLDVEGIDEKSLLIRISNQGIATSGITRRKWKTGEKRVHHLINPKSPNDFSFDLKTVTAICENVEVADFWAKVLFLNGVKNGLLLAEEKGVEAIFLDYNGNFHITSSARKFYSGETS
ncbi:MAG: thiamine biosynthesis lipoprotein [Parcubacteria group bacterium Athens0714_25]|nr:MAG: thiamine biosynthesis lipoprotein [Parcubacteria group bacterium Athens0714_25]